MTYFKENTYITFYMKYFFLTRINKPILYKISKKKLRNSSVNIFYHFSKTFNFIFFDGLNKFTSNMASC